MPLMRQVPIKNGVFKKDHQRLKKLSDDIKEVCALKESAISDQNFEEAAEARDKEKKLRAKRERVLEN